LILSLVPLSQCSLMSRIGLRLGAAHVHHQSALDHKPRQPWAVRNMKAEMLANERKPWQPLNLKPRQIGNIEEEDRPTACVGICYYNKLMALEAKEDLANHNLVYKDQSSNNIPEPCDNNICNDMEEDITVSDEMGPEISPESNVIVIDDEAGAVRRHGHGSSVTGDTIYIDDNDSERLQNDDNTVDFSHAQFA